MLQRIFFFMLILALLVPAPLIPPAALEAAAAGVPGLRVETVDPSGVTLVLETPSYEIVPAPEAGPGYQRLLIPGYETGGKPGAPGLPQVNALLAAPPGARISVEVIDEEIRPVAGEFHLAPIPGPAPLEDDLTPGELLYQPEETVYAADAPYPAAPARLLEEAWLRDQRVVRVALSPFQYNSGRGALVWHPFLRVRVSFNGRRAGDSPRRRARCF